jgi:hypothetical protein
MPTPALQRRLRKIPVTLERSLNGHYQLSFLRHLFPAGQADTQYVVGSHGVPHLSPFK